MSPVSLLEEKRTSSKEVEEGWFVDTSVLLNGELLGSPVNVEGDKLVIDSTKLEFERVYTFNYLDEDMVLWKNANNNIEIFQVIER